MSFSFTLVSVGTLTAFELMMAVLVWLCCSDGSAGFRCLSLEVFYYS